jgi:hypothetical protein
LGFPTLRVQAGHNVPKNKTANAMGVIAQK